jgi:hypothetical protein
MGHAGTEYLFNEMIPAGQAELNVQIALRW